MAALAARNDAKAKDFLYTIKSKKLLLDIIYRQNLQVLPQDS
mgnify:CR=1 FL=1